MTVVTEVRVSPSAGKTRIISSAPDNQIQLPLVDPAQQTTTAAVSQLAGPPPWLEQLIYYVQGPHGAAKVDLGLLKRLASAVVRLPQVTPPPEVGIGSDSSIMMEWDIGPAHFGIQIDPDGDYDGAFYDIDGEPSVHELSLDAALGLFGKLFEQLQSAR